MQVANAFRDIHPEDTGRAAVEIIRCGLPAHAAAGDAQQVPFACFSFSLLYRQSLLYPFDSSDSSACVRSLKSTSQAGRGMNQVCGGFDYNSFGSLSWARAGETNAPISLTSDKDTLSETTLQQ